MRTEYETKLKWHLSYSKIDQNWQWLNTFICSNSGYSNITATLAIRKSYHFRNSPMASAARVRLSASSKATLIAYLHSHAAFGVATRNLARVFCVRLQNNITCSFRCRGAGLGSCEVRGLLGLRTSLLRSVTRCSRRRCALLSLSAVDRAQSAHCALTTREQFSTLLKTRGTRV